VQEPQGEAKEQTAHGPRPWRGKTKAAQAQRAREGGIESSEQTTCRYGPKKYRGKDKLLSQVSQDLEHYLEERPRHKSKQPLLDSLWQRRKRQKSPCAYDGRQEHTGSAQPGQKG